MIVTRCSVSAPALHAMPLFNSGPVSGCRKAGAVSSSILILSQCQSRCRAAMVALLCRERDGEW